ncbi:MAG: ABC transporter ATP-binding protein [Rhodospirillales bacterium]|nr:ABC transporter ATP-binding protein [Rhodospirillales bacterium]
MTEGLQGDAAALAVENVSVSYGKKQVVKSLSLDVRAGETFGLIGLNGVGKTTLIKSILGLREYDHGSIMIEERDRRHPDSKKRIAYLPERFEPPWFLSGLEFLRFSESLYKVHHDLEQVYTMSERLALDPAVLKNRVQTYSKGMRQKLGILGTLLTECPLLILDEPMSGLDPRARTMVKDLLGEARAGGRTIFLSSHILADMNEICDRVGVLHHGSLVFIGTPAELRQKGGNDNLERAFLQVIDDEIAA